MLMGGAVFPPSLLFGWGFSPLVPTGCCWVGPALSKMAAPRVAHTLMIPWGLCPQCPTPTVSRAHPCFPDTLHDLRVDLSQVLMESLLCPGTQGAFEPGCALQERKLCSPQSRRAPAHASPAGPPHQMLRGSSSQGQTLRHGDLTWVGHSHSCGGASVLGFFQSVACPPAPMALLLW